MTDEEKRSEIRELVERVQKTIASGEIVFGRNIDATLLAYEPTKARMQEPEYLRDTELLP